MSQLGRCPDFHEPVLFSAGQLRRMRRSSTGRYANDSHSHCGSVGRVRFVERRRLIRPALLKSLLLALQRTVEAAANDRRGRAGDLTELGTQLIKYHGDQAQAMRIVPVMKPRHPKCARVVDRQVARLVRKAGADPWVGVVLL